MNLINTDILLFLSTLLTIAVINDIRYRKIPNLLTYPAMIIAIAYNSWLTGFAGFLFSIEGIGLGISLLIIFHFMGGMGAGDVKLMGAIGGFVGPKIVFAAFLFTAIIGGIHALVVLTLKGHAKETIKRYLLMLKTLLLTKKITYLSSSKEEKEKLYK
jgi:prepilin peptidase CpaA